MLRCQKASEILADAFFLFGKMRLMVAPWRTGLRGSDSAVFPRLLTSPAFVELAASCCAVVRLAVERLSSEHSCGSSTYLQERVFWSFP